MGGVRRGAWSDGWLGPVGQLAQAGHGIYPYNMKLCNTYAMTLSGYVEDMIVRFREGFLYVCSCVRRERERTERGGEGEEQSTYIYIHRLLHD